MTKLADLQAKAIKTLAELLTDEDKDVQLAAARIALAVKAPKMVDIADSKAEEAEMALAHRSGRKGEG